MLLSLTGRKGEVALNTGEGSGSDIVVNNTSTPYTLTIGDQVSGFVNTPTDQDWYRVDLVAGQSYTFTLTKTSGDLDCWLEIHDSGGALLHKDDDGGPELNSDMRFVCTQSGVYYISAQAYHDNTQSSTGGYTLTSAASAAPDVLDSVDWGTQVPVPSNVTVYFATTGESFGGYTSQGWNAYQKQQVMAALQTYSNIANLTFTETFSSAGATFKLVTANSSDFLGQMGPPGTAGAGIAVFATNGSGWATAPGGGLEPGSQGWITLIHEFGHGLGLAHPHDNGGDSQVMQRVLDAFDSYGLFNLDQGIFTTMSYNRGWETGPNGLIFSQQYGQATPMALDVAIIQAKYGANTSYRIGNDVYQLPTSNSITTNYQALWDAGGTDTIAYAGSSTSYIDLNPATLDYSVSGGGNVSWVLGVYGGFTIAQGVVIENATGGSGNDTIVGNAAANAMDLSAGGTDIARGGLGDDSFYFGAAFTAADTVDGGAGTNDQIGLQGDYSGGLTLGASTITGVEVIAALPGFDYLITTVNENVGAGTELAIYGGDLGAGDNLTFNGSAETDGRFRTFGGLGVDTVTGGSGDDGFYFGPGGRYGASDIVSGGGGTNDQLGLDGNYTVTLGPGLSGIEVIVMIQKPTAALNTFNLTTTNALVAAGQQLIIYGVQVVNPLSFNGVAETDGRFLIFGGQGADTIAGGSGADWIRGGLGADMITGGGGADTFSYDLVAQSNGAAFDTLTGFDFAADRIDLPGTIDAYSSVTGGRLDVATFAADLAAIAAGLTAGQAIVFSPTTGSFAGAHFILADGDGAAGFQSASDYLFRVSTALPGGPPPDFII